MSRIVYRRPEAYEEEDLWWLGDLKPPPEARIRQGRAVEALDQAQRLVEEAGQTGVPRREAPQLAKRLREFGKELANP